MQNAIPSIPVTSRRPLVSLETIAWLKDSNFEAVKKEVEKGQLNPAWDLRSQKAFTSTIRVLTRALECPINEADVYNWVPNCNLLASQLPRLLSCSAEHIRNLIKEGLLETTGVPKREKVSPRIKRESLLYFLTSRRIGYNGLMVNSAVLTPFAAKSLTAGRCTRSAYALKKGFKA